MKINREATLSHARAAGMASATAGRARAFADKRVLLPGIRAAEALGEIADGIAEYQERKARHDNAA